MKIGQARLSTIAPVQRCILLEPGGWPRSAKCSSAVPEAQPAGRGKVCKGPRQDVRCLHRDDLAAADSRCLSRFSVPLLPKPQHCAVGLTIRCFNVYVRTKTSKNRLDSERGGLPWFNSSIVILSRGRRISLGVILKRVRATTDNHDWFMRLLLETIRIQRSLLCRSAGDRPFSLVPWVE
jgi:hypothetical protein